MFPKVPNGYGNPQGSPACSKDPRFQDAFD